MKQTPSCRLHILLAREAPVGLILRRGPSAWFHLIKWNTAKDTFEHGAWFKGRIYEDKCDLSPDGSLFVYFASKFKIPTDRTHYAWTAISRPPWLKALALWPQDGTYNGGGIFLNDRTVGLDLPRKSLPSDGTDPNGMTLKVQKFPSQSYRPAKPAVPTRTPPNADWVGVDQKNRFVFSRRGKLFTGAVEDGELQETKLADFNGLKPEPREAPAWAKRW